ncbi:major facilitator superfamily domain-containing protein [Crassisporium funariophilum]|nr:major facilitator superfamily domain-containing protein [Crassisporium funariophilum]
MFSSFKKSNEYNKPAKALKRSRALQSHRVGRIYEPDLNDLPSRSRSSPRSARFFEPESDDLPTRPRPVRTHPERPVPIVGLPGLPPRSLPTSVVKDRKKALADGWFANAGTWLAQFRPWSAPSDASGTSGTSVSPPPYTPKTAKFVNDARSIHKDSRDLEDFDDTLPDGPFDYKDTPPPLYQKVEPEGGIRGWTTVAGAFLIQFCTIGYLFTWNVFEDHYNHVFLTDQSPAVVRLIGSVQFFLAFGLSLVSGKLADAGYYQHVVLGGSALFSISLFLLSLINEEQFGRVFACQALGMGIGIGLVFVPTATACLHYFRRQRGLAIGIVMSGGSFGGMIFPPILRGAIPGRGMGGAVRITAYIILGCLVIANCLMVTPPKEEEPLYPLPHLDLAKYSKELGYIFAAAGTFLTMLVIYFPVMYLDLLGLERGVDQKSAFTSVVVLSFTGIIGRASLGFASDMFGVWNVLMPVSGGLALTMFTVIGVQGTKSLVVVSIFYGFFSGAWLSLMVTALSSLAARPSENGTRVGLILTPSSLACLLSFTIHNGMLTPKFMWVIPSVISGVLLLGVTALAFLSRTQFSQAQRAKTRRVPRFQGFHIL